MQNLEHMRQQGEQRMPVDRAGPCWLLEMPDVQARVLAALLGPWNPRRLPLPSPSPHPLPIPFPRPRAPTLTHRAHLFPSDRRSYTNPLCPGRDGQPVDDHHLTITTRTCVTVLARFWRRARRFWVTRRGRPHRGVELCVSHTCMRRSGPNKRMTVLGWPGANGANPRAA